jgi:hypothetical protein
MLPLHSYSCRSSPTAAPVHLPCHVAVLVLPAMPLNNGCALQTSCPLLAPATAMNVKQLAPVDNGLRCAAKAHTPAFWVPGQTIISKSVGVACVCMLCEPISAMPVLSPEPLHCLQIFSTAAAWLSQQCSRSQQQFRTLVPTAAVAAPLQQRPWL